MPENLEIVIKEKVKPIIESAMQRFLGITVDEISGDISDKLKKSPLLDVEIDTSMPLKKAKDRFRRFYLKKLLQNHFGNISKVADIAGVDRRSIHRMAKRLNIGVEKFRKDMMRSDYIKQEAVRGIIENSLESYRQAINPVKLEKMYSEATDISKDIVKQLPETPLPIKEAEHEFEKRFITKALRENDSNITKTAKKIGLRYESLHRKIKFLGIVLGSAP